MKDEIEDQGIPPDLVPALTKNEPVRAFFDNLPASSDKNILRWMNSARVPETSTAQISRTVELAAANRIANHAGGRHKGPAPEGPRGA